MSVNVFKENGSMVRIKVKYKAISIYCHNFIRLTIYTTFLPCFRTMCQVTDF